MRIHILTVGSRGDVQPYIGLGQALKRFGHTVTICTHGNFRTFVEQHRLQFADMGGDVMEAIAQRQTKEWMETGRNPIKFITGFRDIMARQLEEGARQAAAACADADAIIGSGTGFYVGKAIAEVKNIPFIQAYVVPVHPTTEFPSAVFPTAIRGGAFVNGATHWLGGGMIWQALRPAVNGMRRNVFDLPPISPILGPILQMDMDRTPALYGYSPSILAKPQNWKDWHHVTGYWFSDEPDWHAPPMVQQFLADGAPPICVGFGSISDTNPEQTTDAVLNAIKHSGQRAIVLTGWGGIKQADVPDNVLVLDQAPHSWLFPRCKAIVHHGGSGTSGAAFRSGKPAVVVPFFGDQPFWAERAKLLGTGAVIQKRDLTAERLAEAIKFVCANEGLRSKAETIGRCVRSETGSATGARLVHEYLNRAAAAIPVA